MGFKSTTTLIADGTPVNAATTNPCLNDLQSNILYLKSVVDGITGGQALIQRSVAMATTVVVGNAVYYNSGSAQYDLALADGTAREAVTGVCLNKTATNVGDMLTAGFQPLDITVALQTGDTLQAGRYYLSPTQAGKLTAFRPQPRAVPILIADGLGSCLVMPGSVNRGFQGYRGWQGVTGMRGWQGWRGYQGILVATSAGSATGTSVDGYVTIYDSGTSANGLLLAATIKNTGANGLTYNVIATDVFGTTDSVATNVSAGVASATITTSVAYNTALPPILRVQIQVKSQNTGQPTTYNLKLVRTAG